MNRDCVSREISREIVVGAFVLMVALGIGYFTIILSREPWFGPRRELQVNFDDVRGLREGDNVVVRGVTVGSVAEIAFDNEGVNVRLRLTYDLLLRDDYLIRVVPSSLLGGTYLQIDLGSGTPIENQTVLRGSAPIDVMEVAGTILEDLRKELIDGHFLANLSSSAASLSNLFKRVETGEGLLGKLFSAEDMTLYSDLSSAVSNVNAIVARVEQGKGTLGRLLSEDETLYSDLQDTVASARRIITDVEAGKGSLGRLLSEDETLFSDLQDTVASARRIVADVEAGKGSLGKLLREEELYDNINEAMADLRAVATDIRERKGLVGRLISDEKLADRVDSAVNEVQAMIDDMRDTSPISTFTSIFFGAF